MMMQKAILLIISFLLLSACTEETMNKLSRQADNFLGEDLKVSYVDGGKVIKSWTVKDGKITTGKDDQGRAIGYYYFWSIETGYVQLPIERTLIEEIREPNS
jgi:outer membrane biogenesis lipoprotein LolB